MKNLLKGGVLSVLMLGALCYFVAGAMAEPDWSKWEAPAPDHGDVHGAWAAAQQFVEKRLKPPRSADFPFGGHRDVTPLGGGRFRFSSHVDAQNSFGATRRTHFDGVVRRAPSGWELESLSFRN